ncbi:MAG: autotransporter-associated beta strand repeat-containing protein [Verrucomicrobia bacterium]|nr:autotransporter-associated beta strand repeat-containing protein [Verrucomicrobiota bacterium]
MNPSFILRLVRTRPIAAHMLAGALATLLASQSASAADPAWNTVTGNGLLAGRARENIPAASPRQDDAATARLRQPGHYESLMQAVQAARYAVETVPDPPATGPGGGVYAGNPAQALHCWFRADGLELQSAGTRQAPWQLKLRLRGYGRETMQAADVAGVSARQNRVELSRAKGAVVEWYANTAAGLEQGFTVYSVPPGGTGALRILLEADGDLRPELEQDSGTRAVRFVTVAGRAALRYSGLKVWDATQRELPAHLEVQGTQLALVVNDRDATYPVTIDPLITTEEAQLTAGDGAANDNFGNAVTLSADGNTALVGAYSDDTPAGADAGSAYVFVRSGTTWNQQAKLTAGDAAANDRFGQSVSLSADGNTALVGAAYDDTPAGADAGSAYVFVRGGTTWSQQAKLTAGDGAAGDIFGNAVSVSGDGNTALVGAFMDSTSAGSGAGSAYVFVRNVTTWSQQSKLTAGDGAAGDKFGISVSVSGIGTTALVGSYWHNTTGGGLHAGSAYVFDRSGTTWSQQPHLTASDGAANDFLGYSVHVSGDGITALVGAYGDDTPAGADAGSAYVFARSGGTWMQQEKLTAYDGAAGDWFGVSVRLSGMGDTALVGARYNDTPAGPDTGSAYLFARGTSTWSPQLPKLSANDGETTDNFGIAVSLSGDGNTALIGAYWADTPGRVNAGSAYVFRLANPLLWSGTVNGDWDLNTTANWTADGFSAKYGDGDIPAFDDSATRTTVNLTTTLAPGGVTVTNSSKDYTFTGSGKLTGPTGLTKNGTGVLTLLTDNDFTGATIINEGTLQLGNGGTSGSVTSNLMKFDDGIAIGSVIWMRSGVVTYAGTISGIGNVTQAGPGTLILTGNNTYTLNTTVLSGTLSLAHAYLDDASTLTIASGAVLDLPHGVTDRVGALVIGGVSQPNGLYDSTNTGGAITGTGKIQVGPLSSAADILTFVFPGLPATTIAGTSISMTVPCGTDVTALAPTYSVSPGATGAPPSGTTRNFTSPQSYTVTAADGITTKNYTVTVTLAATSSVTYAGLAHTALGNATLCVESSKLVVANLGSSGNDGVEVAMPANAVGWEAQLDPIDEDAQDDSFLRMQILGTAGPVTNGLLGTAIMTKAGTDDYVASADFSPLGAGSVTVEVYSGNNLVAQKTATEASPGGGIFTNLLTAMKWPTDVHAKLKLWPLPPKMQWIWTYPPATGLVIDCELVAGDRVVVTPVVASGVSAFSAVRIVAAPIPSLTITSETFTVAKIWAGTISENWDLGTTSNWTAGGSAATYTDGDAVAFDDSATRTTVNLTTALAPGMVTVDNNALNYSFTGPGKLTGPAGLTKNGTGVLTVLTDNDYTGGTIIEAGTLQLGNGGTSGSLTGNLIDRGTLIWNRTGAVTFAGTISGTGALVQAGPGTLTLTGVNTHSGPTTVSAGTLRVTGSLAASSAVNVAAPGTLVLADNAGMNFIVGDASGTQITGTGAVTLDGFCTIDTSAVTATTGSWTLVHVATLAATFGPTFVVAGADWSETANVWTKLEGAKTWTFSEATGVLTLSTVSGTILPVVTQFDHAANTATLAFESRAGFIYHVEFSTTLANASWTLLESVVATTTLTTVTDYYATSPRRFYRVSCQGPLTGALTQLEPPQDPPGQPGGQSQPAAAAWPPGEASPSDQWAVTRQAVPGSSPPDDALPYLFSGEFHTTTTDLSIRGRGTDFVLTRSYRSKVGPTTAQGSGWDFSYNIHVEPAAPTQGSGFEVFDGNGRKDTYQLRPDGTYGADQLAREGTYGNNVFTLKFADNGRWEFRPFDGSASQGKIYQSIDRNGNALTFQYATDGKLTTVVDTLGRNIQFAYNADGLLQSVTDFTGRVVSYAYYQNGDPGGSAGDLKAVTYPAVTGTPNGNDFPTGKTVTYTYATGFTDARLNHNLLTITDAKGQTWLRNTYATTTNPADPDFDKLLRQARGNPNEVITFWYAAVSPTTANRLAVSKAIVNDGTGNVSEHLFEAMNRLVRLREFTGRAVPGLTTTETQNRPSGKLRPGDPVFFETIQEWNVDSRLTRTIHPDGSSVANTYELALNPAAPPRLRGNLRERHRLPGPLGGDQAELIETFVYDTSFGGGCCGFNFVTAATDARGNLTRHTYDNHGNRLTTTHPLTSIMEDFEYNAFGQMTARVHPDRGDGYRRRDTWSYHASGPQTGYLNQQVTDAAGFALTTAYEYDAAGNVVRIVDPRGYDSLYSVNSLNQLVRERSPVFATGSTVRYTKDYFYDATNNLVRAEVPNVDETGTLSATNPSFTTTHDYDILNTLVRTTREVDPGHNVVTETAYDANRNPILVRYGQATSGADPFNTLTVLYDERNLVFREIRAQGSPLQATTQSDYDANRNLVRTSAGLESCPRITAATFDGYHRRMIVTDPMGNVTTNHYDANGNLLSTRADGELIDLPESAANIRLAATTHTYDAMNRRTRSDLAHFAPQTQSPIGDGQATTLTSYDGNSQIIADEDDNGHLTSTAYDTAGRPATKTDAIGDTVSFTYDPNGNVTAVIERDHGTLVTATSSYTYDPLNRQVGSVNPLGHTTQAGYDSRNNRVTAVDGRANRVSYTYDGLNRMVQTTRHLTTTGEGGGTPSGTITTRQTWDDSSRLTSQTDDNAHSTSYGYDALDRRIRVECADGTASSTEYDVHGNRTTDTDANGTVVQASHDLLDRETGRTVTRAAGIEGTTFEEYQYDGLSRVVRAANDDTAVTLAYDSLSKVSTETQQLLPAGPVRTVTSTHDGVGNRLACTYPSGRVVNTTFDPLKRPLRITMPSSPLTYLASYTYVNRTQIIRDYGNDTRATANYDLLGRMTGALHGNVIDLTPIDSRTYVWDAAGNKTAMNDLLAPALDSKSFTYDSVSRLVTSQPVGSGPIIEYTLDGAGNRVVVTGGGHAGSYYMSATVPPADFQVNQYTATPSGPRVNDANGNLTNTGQQEFHYDCHNRLVRAWKPSSAEATSFKYDCFGRRVERTHPNGSVTRHYYTGWQEIEEQDDSNMTVATQVWGREIDELLYMDRGGQEYFYHADTLGSIRKVTNASGHVVEQYRYGDYGEPSFLDGGGAPLSSSQIGNDTLFTGRRYDPKTGLYYYRTRYQDPVAGRFITRDSIGIWGDEAAMGNAYTYAGNNPWSALDPQGTAMEYNTGVPCSCSLQWGTCRSRWVGSYRCLLLKCKSYWILFDQGSFNTCMNSTATKVEFTAKAIAGCALCAFTVEAWPACCAGAVVKSAVTVTGKCCVKALSYACK